MASAHALAGTVGRRRKAQYAGAKVENCGALERGRNPVPRHDRTQQNASGNVVSQ
jgi:hypothetical protein